MTSELLDNVEPTILLVDDDDVFRRQLARALTRRGWRVLDADNHASALRVAREALPERAVVDLRMPGPSGLEVLRDLLAIDPHTRVVMLTGYGSIDTAVEAIRIGAAGYVPKPADADDVLAAFERSDREPLSGAPDEGPMAPSLARAEWEHINRVLGDCSGNISEAARRLGVHRRTLQRKLQKYPPRV